MVFNWSFSDSKSPTLSLNIQANLGNALIWTASTWSLICKSSYRFWGLLLSLYYLWVIHIWVTWSSFTWVWVTASLLGSPGLFFSVFKQIFMLCFWLSPLVLISKSSSAFTSFLEIVPSATITVIFMFQFFFSSLAKCKYVSLFSFSFIFTLWSARKAMSPIRWVLSLSLFLLTITRSGLLAGIR